MRAQRVYMPTNGLSPVGCCHGVSARVRCPLMAVVFMYGHMQTESTCSLQWISRLSQPNCEIQQAVIMAGTSTPMFQLPCTAKCFARFVKFALELQWGYLSECKTSTIARVLIDIADTRGVTYLIDTRWKLHAQPRAFIRIFILTISRVGFDFKWQT